MCHQATPLATFRPTYHCSFPYPEIKGSIIGQTDTNEDKRKVSYYYIHLYCKVAVPSTCVTAWFHTQWTTFKSRDDLELQTFCCCILSIKTLLSIDL